MLFYVILFFILLCFIICVVIIRYNAIQTHAALKISFRSLSDHYYHWTMHDTGCLEDMSIEIDFTDFYIVANTIIKRRRKYTNSFLLLISLFDNNKRIIVQNKLRISDAINSRKLFAVISSMLEAYPGQSDKNISFNNMLT